MRSRKTINRKKSTSLRHKSQPSRTNETTLDIQKQNTSKPKAEWTIDRLTTTYVPPQIVGRQQEKLIIDNFVQNCLMNRIGSKVLYISGIPGVGKTASTIEILKKLEHQSKNKVNIGFINALTLKKPDQVYRLLLSIITGGQEKQHSKKTMNVVKKIEQVLPTLSKPHIILIDEVDFLLTKDQTIFYNLFEWVYQVTAKLGLIIIANTMDFPQKLSGKVNSRMGNNRLVFKPYSYEQIKAIIQERLQGCKLFAANALVFAAKKLSTYSSDIRTILQVLYKAVQNHLQKQSKTKIKIQQIVALWDQKISQGNATNKNQNLTNLHSEILQYLRRHDNECSSRDALDVFIQKGVKPHNFTILLKQLEQMNYLIMTEQRGSMFPNYTLRLVQRFKI